MLNAITASLPIALGIILATLPLVAVPLILLTRRQTGVLMAFMAGYVAGFMVLGGTVILAADLFSPNPAGPSTIMIGLRIALGLVLLWLAWQKWQGRAGQDADPELPGWMRTIDTIQRPKAASLGFLLVVVNPKNAVLVVSGALAIASVTDAPFAQIGALMIFTIVSSLGIAAPFGVWLVMGELAIPPLERMKAFMARHNTAIMTGILVILGVVVILNTANYL